MSEIFTEEKLAECGKRECEKQDAGAAGHEEEISPFVGGRRSFVSGICPPHDDSSFRSARRVVLYGRSKMKRMGYPFDSGDPKMQYGRQWRTTHGI